MKGTILFYRDDKGYGFITPDPVDDGIYPADYPDEMKQKNDGVFFHIRKAHLTKEELQPGTRVEFDTRRTDKGLAATYVTKARD